MADGFVISVDIGTTSLKTALVDAHGNVAAFSQQSFSEPDSVRAADAWFLALCRATREMVGAGGLHKDVRKSVERFKRLNEQTEYDLPMSNVAPASGGAMVKSVEKIKHLDGLGDGYDGAFNSVERFKRLNQLYKNAANAPQKNAVPDILAICVSGNGPTIVSDDGTTLLWNAAIPKTPLPIGTEKSLFLPRVLAFRDLYHEQWNETRFVHSGPEYLIKKLTGADLTILPEARYADAYWTESSLATCGVPQEKVPPFAPPAFNAGLTTDDAADALGLAKVVPVFCGGPDFIAAMVGTASLSRGKVYDCAGSSEGLNICTDAPIFEKDIRALPSVVPNLWNAAVLQQESGRVFVNYKKSVEAAEGREFSYAELISRVIKERRGDGFELLERVANNLKKSVDALFAAAKKHGVEPTLPVVVTGGQAKNEEWMQIKCDYAGVPLAVCNSADAELLGDAAFAFYGLGVYRSIETAATSIVKIAKVYEPRERR